VYNDNNHLLPPPLGEFSSTLFAVGVAPPMLLRLPSVMNEFRFSIAARRNRLGMS
jgi:hypothetical protein